MSRKRNIWRGLTTLTASLLTVSVAAGPVVDSYRTDIDKIFHAALQEPSIEGVIINPWNRTIMLNKTLINIILGNPV